VQDADADTDSVEDEEQPTDSPEAPTENEVDAEDAEEEAVPPALEMIELRVGRFQVPEDADDMLGLAHRLPGVVHVWLNGNTLCLECEPGLVDRDALVSRLQDDGYPIRTA
jgi:hypothetical protein